MRENRQDRSEEERLDYQAMMAFLDGLCAEYPTISIRYLGESIMGKGIPLVSIGEGEKVFLYIGGQRGRDWRTSALLLRWLREYGMLLRSGSKIYRFTAEYLFRTRTICVIPMLNPDGMEYCQHGIGEDHILRDRLLTMNGGSDDFSEWQANGRGVSLKYNFTHGFAEHKRWEAEQGILGGAPEGYGGESSESEPETGYLCNFLRYTEGVRMIVHLHEGERGLQCVGALGQEPRSEGAQNAFSRMVGIGNRGGKDPMIESFAEELGILGCSIGLGSDLQGGDLFRIYTELREFLFCAPTMV